MTTSVLVAERLLFVSYNLGALLASWSLARLLVDRHSLATRILATTLGFPLIVILTSTVLGIFGQLTAWAATVTVGLEAVGLTTYVLRRPSQTPTTRFSLSKREWILTGAAVAVLLLLAEQILAKQLFEASHFHWDDFSYHGPKVAHWLQAERLTLAPYSYHAYYPGNAELFCAWFMLSSHLDAFSTLATLYWLFLGVVVVVATCRKLRVSPSASIFAAVVFLAVRPFRFDAGSFAAVDLAGSVLMGAAVAMALVAVSERQTRAAFGPTVYCACAVGLAAGCKITFAPIAAVILIWLIVAQRRNGIAKLGELFGVFGVCAMLCGGYWFARNWVIADNPVFPADLWVFEGPMDEEARWQTSLAYQISLLDTKGFEEALKKLLNWPRRIAFVLLAGYGVTTVSFLWPYAWRDRLYRNAIIVALIGFFALAVAAFGPFSGTVNNPRSGLHIRLRFFLCFALLATPLVGYWVDRTKKAKPVLLLIGLVFIGDAVRLPILTVFVFGVLGAAFAWMISNGYLDKTHGLQRPIAVALCCICTVALHYTAVQKQPLNDRWLSRQIGGWNALNALPTGARLTWHATFEDAKYYRSFGHGLRLVPIRTRADGSQFLALHEEWRTAKKTWWQPWRRKYRMKDYIDNLLAQRIEYVFLMKRSKGEWPRQYKILLESERALHVVDYPSYAVFELQYPHEQRVHP